MLRPATPLSILLFASFVLLLISVISTPIIHGIPLASFQGVNFGVFGWCKDNGQCSRVHVGWNTGDALPNGGDGDFNLPSNARHSLSSLLIVHPVAALCNLIVLGLAIAAHFHSPSHSARYLLGLLILLLPTLLVTLLAFLVDILLFVPHLQWGGWIVLASTILITASGVVTCAMRRTLVSRKARKKRIAENAEMSGANFYARQAEENTKLMMQPSTESKAPMVNGAPGSDNLPAFATYTKQSEERPANGPSPTDPVSATSPLDPRYYGGQRSISNSRPRRDDFGAPLGAARSMEDRPPMPMPNRGGYGPPPRGGYPPRGAISSRGIPTSRGPPGTTYRGRGGYPPRGRGYPPGPIPPSAMIPAGMSRRPPPGYGPQNPSPQGYGPPLSVPNNSYLRPNEPGYEPPSPSNYGTDINAGPAATAYGARAQSPAQRHQSPYGARVQSPAGVETIQEVPPAMPDMPGQYGMGNHLSTLTDMDSDVLGMVEMQRARAVMKSQPSSEEYIPPRAGWSNNPQADPQLQPAVRRKRVNSGSDYVEDVDPRFAELNAHPSAPTTEAFHHPHSNANPTEIPSLLLAGHKPENLDANSKDPSPESSASQIPGQNSYVGDDVPPGSRSPVESETSNFTSVSQRPMNPNWQPGYGGEFNSFGPAPGPGRQHQQRKQDMLFSGNPDFELPGFGQPRGGGYRGRGRGGYGRAGAPTKPLHPSVLEGLSGDGRYPSPVPPPEDVHGGAMKGDMVSGAPV